MSFNVSIVSNGLQLENLAQAQPTMERPWERLLQVRMSHRYHMRFSDTCSSSHSPPVVATGIVAPGSTPLLAAFLTAPTPPWVHFQDPWHTQR